MWLMLVLGAYALSFGPVLRYAAKSTTLRIPTGSGQTVMAQGVTYPQWVNACFAPVYQMTGHDLRPEYGHHDLINVYKRYLQWWTP